MAFPSALRYLGVETGTNCTRLRKLRLSQPQAVGTIGACRSTTISRTRPFGLSASEILAQVLTSPSLG